MTLAASDAMDAQLCDEAGSRIGVIRLVFLDNITAQPTFVSVKTGLFGNREVLVPVHDAYAADSEIHVPYPADLIRQAPLLESDTQLNTDDEAAIYTHFGVHYTEP